MDNEIWKEIELCDGRYSVSNIGRIRNNGFYTSGKIRKRVASRIKANGLVKGKYEFTNIHGKNYLIHRLVALAFIPNPDSKAEVNHINGVTTDNRVENLEWCSRSENEIHAHKTGLKKGASCIEVLNTVTGERYKSIKDASKHVSFCERQLQRMLCGKVENKTNLIRNDK
jgi:hypothetical protein